MRKYNSRVVMPDMLLEFNHTYMPINDLAKLVGDRVVIEARAVI